MNTLKNRRYHNFEDQNVVQYCPLLLASNNNKEASVDGAHTFYKNILNLVGKILAKLITCSKIHCENHH